MLKTFVHVQLLYDVVEIGFMFTMEIYVICSGKVNLNI